MLGFRYLVWIEMKGFSWTLVEFNLFSLIMLQLFIRAGDESLCPHNSRLYLDILGSSVSAFTKPLPFLIELTSLSTSAKYIQVKSTRII